MNVITEKLLAAQDIKYRDFNKKIVPDTRYEMIGVKLPEIRKIVNSVVADDMTLFFESKHVYYEEYMAHGLLISKLSDEKEAYLQLERFLPLIDNWAICDTVALSLKRLSKNNILLFRKIETWLKSEKVYTVRFGIVCLLSYFTEKEYSDTAFKAVSEINTDEYYINMAIAWFYSVMLVKNYDATLKIIESKTLPRFIQNKTVDKARDSFRIDKNKKEYLKTLKI